MSNDEGEEMAERVAKQELEPMRCAISVEGDEGWLQCSRDAEHDGLCTVKFRAENFEAEVTEVETDAWVVVAQGNKAKSLRLLCDPCVTGSELQLLTDRGWVCLSCWRQPDKFLTRLAAAIALLYSVPGVEHVP